jgi:hypothetical protein
MAVMAYDADARGSEAGLAPPLSGPAAALLGSCFWGLGVTWSMMTGALFARPAEWLGLRPAPLPLPLPLPRGLGLLVGARRPAVTAGCSAAACKPASAGSFPAPVSTSSLERLLASTSVLSASLTLFLAVDTASVLTGLPSPAASPAAAAAAAPAGAVAASPCCTAAWAVEAGAAALAGAAGASPGGCTTAGAVEAGAAALAGAAGAIPGCTAAGAVEADGVPSAICAATYAASSCLARCSSGVTPVPACAGTCPAAPLPAGLMLPGPRPLPAGIMIGIQENGSKRACNIPRSPTRCHSAKFAAP